MAMATAVTGTSTAVLQRQFLGSGLRIRPQHARAALHTTAIISSKLAKEELESGIGYNALAGAVFAALASVESASAAQQAVAELAAGADSDSRGLALLVPLVPAVGWVLFNILRPGLNQFERMKNAKGVAIGLGGLGAMAALAASTPPHAAAAAAREIAELAESDSRGLAVLGVLVPAIGWVLYNILRPALNQFDRMKASKGVIGAIGIGAAAAAAGLGGAPETEAAAAQEIASIAESDNRGLLLLLVILPAIGWVLFNILKPALNQLNNMKSK
ncbi:photosystem II core complex proteins psbY, chloroplastic [Selaginella moellendorffii]|uniref:photosystem II core complex proteins psbY, chloroplastic n=1 Tax=Selaginella moellendorffii TaxID=88036 RepID=UPI000D1CC5CA|nr:photosystem II core complex proteins psbY, chloroplastic [Selaginella moellendorffii]|eukprot:XP_024532492.1 photosystem II core complex proteins psbY, chloroplastic [Selaginella moellendorffii]